MQRLLACGVSSNLPSFWGPVPQDFSEDVLPSASVRPVLTQAPSPPPPPPPPHHHTRTRVCALFAWWTLCALQIASMTLMNVAGYKQDGKHTSDEGADETDEGIHAGVLKQAWPLGGR